MSRIVPLGLVVLIVGGIAWAVQYHRSWKQPPPPKAAPTDKPSLEFTQNVAVWQLPDPENSKYDRNFKEFEIGMTGHYDFPFRNLSDETVELGLEKSSCDCASIRAATIPLTEWNQVAEAQKKNPGEPLPYAQEPSWQDLPNSPGNIRTLLVKPREVGILQVQWHPRKSPGSQLNLQPVVWWQPVGNLNGRKKENFFIPAMMTYPIRFDPQRVSVGVLSAGGSNKRTITVWSPTRDKLDYELKGTDSLLKVEQASKPMSARERADLEKQLFFRDRDKIRTRVLFAQNLTVTAYEQKDGKLMDQGVFLRKLQVFLDHIFQEDVPGPEITGRVQGDVTVGGSDDEGKIRFKSFQSSAGASKVVELSTTNPKLELAPDKQSPPTLEVELTPDKKNSTPERRVWRLKVIVPPNALLGSFTETDAVTLRIEIKGEAPRFVRIPIEGQVGGR